MSFGPVDVVIDQCQSMAQVAKAICGRGTLYIPQDSTLTLWSQDGLDINRACLQDIVSLGKEGKEVVVCSSPLDTVLLSRLRKLSVRKLKGKCEDCMRMIVRNLARSYRFRSEAPHATIADLFRAKDGVEGVAWAPHTWFSTQIVRDWDGIPLGKVKKGHPQTCDRLPDVFTSYEWDLLATVSATLDRPVLPADSGNVPNSDDSIDYAKATFSLERMSEKACPTRRNIIFRDGTTLHECELAMRIANQ